MELSINYLKMPMRWIIDVLLPEKCVSCNLKGSVICDKCVPKLRRVERETGSNIHALYDYRDPAIKRAIWKLKYHHRKNIGDKLGQLLFEEFAEDISEIHQYLDNQPIYVIPIPISKEKLRKRGYNQSLTIAKGFCDCSSKNLELKDNLVIKTKETIPQAKIANRIKRLNNIKGVFKIKNEEFIKGKTFIIIDDVTTTGATLTEIYKLLKNAGAKKILCFAVAH